MGPDPQANLTSIVVTPPSPSIIHGQSQQFWATGIYNNGTSQDLTAVATWSSSDQTIATIDATGMATGVGDGAARITATYSGSAGSSDLIVSELALVSISVAPASMSLQVGLTQQYGAIGTYTDMTQQNLTGFVSWSSSDTSVAQITASGFVVALAAGAVDIVAASDVVWGSAALTVAAAAPSPGPTPPAPGTPAYFLFQAQQAMFQLLLGNKPSRVDTPQLGSVEFSPTTPAQLQRVIDYLQGLVQAGNTWPSDGSAGNMAAGYTRGRKPFSFMGWP